MKKDRVLEFTSKRKNIDEAPDNPQHVCPKCNLYTGYRIPNPKIIDRYFFWLSLHRFKCTHCSNKFFIIIRD
ncbi:hypothetical protein ADIARSV_2711 [Arcticibacter svalbardensis MN12-7]|uniref:Transposase n=1 Tax=Arcticibacter svalbardensis MN12-7 TaxID=1150600 RepID=R9GQX1_9SPHI|nr:hypothetical protein ADIARSV_2711 [Arcticibacter svalbardensis MN12-7]